MTAAEKTDEDKYMEQQFADAMKSWDKHKRKRALEALFENDSIGYEIKEYKLPVRWFKTWICLLLDRTNGSYLDRNKFCILSYDESSGYESQSWDACWVSPYLFKDWNVCLACDGT